MIVPQIWADFFTAVLLNPACFPWAKKFLSSEACSLLGQPNAGIQFALPASCPSENILPCLYDLELPHIPSTLEEANALSSSQQSPSDHKGKTLASPSSPGTPTEKLVQKASSSPGPWAKNFLDKADHLKHSELLEDPAKRRSK